MRDEGVEMETLRWRIWNSDEDVDMVDGEMRDEDSEMGGTWRRGRRDGGWG